MHAPVARSERAAAQDSWPEDAGVRAEGQRSGGHDNERAIAADKPDRVTKDRIARTGACGKRGEEQQIRCGSERRKTQTDCESSANSASAPIVRKLALSRNS